MISIACLVQGTTLAAAALLYPHVWVPVTAALLVVSELSARRPELTNDR